MKENDIEFGVPKYIFRLKVDLEKSREIFKPLIKYILKIPNFWEKFSGDSLGHEESK